MQRYKYINMVQVKKTKTKVYYNELKYKIKKYNHVRKYKDIFTYLNS